MKLYKFILIFTLSLSAVYAQNAPPFVTYAGQVASGGQPYNGTGQFKFAFVNADANVTYWSHDGTSTAGSEPTAFISVPVNGGYYSILLGNTAISGMGAINPAIFKTYSDIHLRVWFTDGVAAFEEMAPHRPFASVPYALNAGVTPGSVNKSMLASDVLSDLNASPSAGSITQSMLAQGILTYLKPEVSGPPKAVRSLADFRKKITLESGATGKYLTYQWKKNGSALPGETNATLVISEANATHDGNYTVSVTNTFGSVESAQIDLQTNTHRVASAANLEMIWVADGNFTMGSPTTEPGRSTTTDRETEHDVTLTQGFYLGKYEVTQAQYAVVMSGNTNSLNPSPSNWPNNPNRPVEKVSWDDVQIFLTRLNASEQAAGRLPSGWSYVLPTESQWEYACRAGTTTAYSWGATIATSNANYNNTIGQTTDVGQYAANPWGFFDMHGNVFEWTADRYAVYSSGAQTDPTGPASGSSRVFRGGSWLYTGTDLRSAYRLGSSPSLRNYNIGFRVGFKQVQPDRASPELVLSGAAVVTHVAGQAWAEPGVAAHDVRDGDLSGRVSVSGLVDVNRTGLYVLTYTVSDTAGNLATANRKVRVTPPAPTTSTYLVPTAANLEMIWVADGNFTMGWGTSGTYPEHNVTLTKGFYLGKYEVTQAQYAVVMSGNTYVDEWNPNGLNPSPSHWPNNPNRPVEKVSWDHVQVFLSRLNAAEQAAGRLPVGWSYELPTEAEWEYACRAGTTSTYSWGETIDPSKANYSTSGINQTVNVGQYEANPWGFFDMHGNVLEWCADWYGPYPTGNPVIDPTGAASGSTRVQRGGSWFQNLFSSTRLASYRRASDAPGVVGDYSSVRIGNFGFRVGFKQQ